MKVGSLPLASIVVTPEHTQPAAVATDYYYVSYSDKISMYVIPSKTYDIRKYEVAIFHARKLFT